MIYMGLVTDKLYGDLSETTKPIIRLCEEGYLNQVLEESDLPALQRQSRIYADEQPMAHGYNAYVQGERCRKYKPEAVGIFVMKRWFKLV